MVEEMQNLNKKLEETVSYTFNGLIDYFEEFLLFIANSVLLCLSLFLDWRMWHN